jgi:hypothetical protein
MDDVTTTLPVRANIVYASAQDKLLQQIANQIECLTEQRKSFTLVIVYDGSRYRIYAGQNAGIV